MNTYVTTEDKATLPQKPEPSTPQGPREIDSQSNPDIPDHGNMENMENMEEWGVNKSSFIAEFPPYTETLVTDDGASRGGGADQWMEPNVVSNPDFNQINIMVNTATKPSTPSTNSTNPCLNNFIPPAPAKSDKGTDKDPLPRPSAAEDLDLVESVIEALPEVLKSHIKNMVKFRMAEPEMAILTTIQTAGTALGKGLYITSLDDQVHGNLYVMTIAPSGSGKKLTTSCMRILTSTLRRMEAELKSGNQKIKAKAMDIEKRLKSRKISEEERKRLETELDNLSIPNHKPVYHVGHDVTAPFISRILADNERSGYLLVITDEGRQLLERISPRRGENYLPLFTNSFNDPEHTLSRVDGGDMTHHTMENPRITLLMAIQPQTLREQLRSIPTDSGFLQRFFFHFGRSISEHGTTPLGGTKSLNDSDAFNAFVNHCAQAYLPLRDGHEISIGEEVFTQIHQLQLYYHSQIMPGERDSGTLWSGFIARRIELLLKVSLILHTAESWDGKKVNPLDCEISGKTIATANAFVEALFPNTRRFFEEFVLPMVPAASGGHLSPRTATKEGIYEKLKELYLKDGCQNGIPVSRLHQYCKQHMNASQLRELLDTNPELFKVTDSSSGHGKVVIPNPDGDMAIANDA